MPTTRSSAIDLAYRPETYFWAHDKKITLSSDIKGAERKALYERLVEADETELASTLIQEPTLSRNDRESIGRIHPRFMGGEYLPDRLGEEVEIARITIASTTQDVTCVYAKRGKNRIYYRAVDEYGGEGAIRMALLKSTCLMCGRGVLFLISLKKMGGLLKEPSLILRRLVTLST